MNNLTEVSSTSNTFRGLVYDNIVDTIGATPFVILEKFAFEQVTKVTKIQICEFFNPLGSVINLIRLFLTEAALAGALELVSRNGMEGKQ